MENYLSEAFKSLDILDEDVFEVDKDGLTALKDFEDKDEDDNSITVVDPDSETEEDLEDSYIGKVILDCYVCHTDIYKDKEDVVIDEESDLANIGEECPYCYSSEGFKVIGEVKPFVETTFETDDDVEVEVENESLHEDHSPVSFSRKNTSTNDVKSYIRAEHSNEGVKDNIYTISIDWVSKLKNENSVIREVSKALGISPRNITVNTMNGPGGGWPEINISGSLDDLYKALLVYTDGDREYALDLLSDYSDVDIDVYEYFGESLYEDTVKQGKYWVNNGDDGTHGKFRTKKAADEQRKAMFARGYKAESLLNEGSRLPKKSWKKIDTIEGETYYGSVYSPKAGKYGFYGNEIVFDGKRLPKNGSKVLVDIYELPEDDDYIEDPSYPYYALLNKNKAESLKESYNSTLGDLISGDSATLMSPFYLGKTGEVADAGSIVEVSNLTRRSSIPGGYHYKFYDKNGDLFYEDDLWLYNYDLDKDQDDSWINPDLIKVKLIESLRESSGEVFHNDNGKEYAVVERSRSGKNALLNRGGQWIIAWNCPKDSGSWEQGHYFFDEDEARKLWGKKYIKESKTPVKISRKPLKEGWRGTPVKIVSHGSWGDPDLVWNNGEHEYTFNYWDIEDAMWNMFLEETGHKDSESNDPKVEEEFNEYVQDNYEGYLEDVIWGGYFDEGSTNLRDRYKRESLRKRNFRKMKESIEDITIDTGDQEISVSAKDKEKKSDGEMIVPLSDEMKADIEMNSDDVDVDVDEFSEEDFDELGESYLKKVYENVDSYKTTSAKTKGNKLFVEGLIKFNSGKEKKTSFVFESRTITKSGKAKLIGENLQISRGHKSFKLTGTINNGKFISESLNYNYRVKNGNSSQRVYGTAKKSK